MEGIIINYRRGRRTVYGNQLIIEISGIDTKEKASQLLGKKVKVGKFVGVVSGVHGNNGRIRARFDNGLPGQVVGGRVEIVD